VEIDRLAGVIAPYFSPRRELAESRIDLKDHMDHATTPA